MTTCHLSKSLNKIFLLGSLITSTAYSQLEDIRLFAFGDEQGSHSHHINLARDLFTQLSEKYGFDLSFNTNRQSISSENLSDADIFIYVNGYARDLNESQRAAVEQFATNGGSSILIHTALIGGDWGWWQEYLGGTRMNGYPEPQVAEIVVEAEQHTATQFVSGEWSMFDENYRLVINPRPNVEVITSLDETSYDVGDEGMGDHPATWTHNLVGGPTLVTIQGHAREAWTENENFRGMLEGAILWAAEPHIPTAVDNQVRAINPEVSYLPIEKRIHFNLTGLTDVKISIRGIRGKLSESLVLQGNSADVGHLEAGYYTLTLETTQGSWQQKLLIY